MGTKSKLSKVYNHSSVTVYFVREYCDIITNTFSQSVFSIAFKMALSISMLYRTCEVNLNLVFYF